MSSALLDMEAEAIAWHLRLRDGGAEDWESFTRWLEADPARAEAYDAVALADAAITAEAFPVIPANDDWQGNRRGHRTGWATALAAVVGLALLAWVALPWFSSAPKRYDLATSAGQYRTVPLGEGSMVAMNGATRITLDRNDARYAELVSGEATFTVRHDAARPFVVRVADHQIQDVGTSFNLVRDGGRLGVEVIEGRVLFDPAGRAVPLEAGQTLFMRAGGPAVLTRRDPASIAGWRHGQLSFTGAPLEIVAGDLSRSLGVNVAVAPSIRTMPYTGAIRLGSDPGSALLGFASTLGLQARRNGNDWLIEPASRAAR